MNIQRYKLLHYVMIILLMVAPLRSVFAGQLTICDMKTSPSQAASIVGDAVSSAQHCQYVMSSTVADARSNDQSTAKSCCDGDTACSSDCHSAVSVSLLMQAAAYSSALLRTVTFEMLSSTLIVRELIPPSRPPLFLYS